jgi:hypothetical protein
MGQGRGQGRGSNQAETHPFRTAHAHADRTPHRSPIQASIANRSDVALAAIVSQLANRLFADRSRSGVVVQIHLERPNLKNDAEDIDKSYAVAVIEEKFTLWASREDAPAPEVSGLMNALNLDMAD